MNLKGKHFLKLLDFTPAEMTYLIDLAAKLKDQKKNQVVQKVKEIKFRLNIDTHDYEVKLNHGIGFLEEGNKLKVTIMFKGRELAHQDKGFELVNKITEDLTGKGTLDAPGKLLGRNICVSYSPVKG